MGILEEVNRFMKFGQAPAGGTNREAGGNGGNDSRAPGYARITAWVKKKYKNEIGSAGPAGNAELAVIAGNAVTGLSAKTKKGFLEYLKKQNYEQLLR